MGAREVNISIKIENIEMKERKKSWILLNGEAL